MLRTLNYTGRSEIKKKDALFSFSDGNSSNPEFNVAFNFNLDDYPENASIYVEAYHKETRQRFEFGTIGNLRPPSNRRLDQLDLTGPTLFRVLIVDETGRHGLLLASGDQFRADEGDEEERKSSLLAIRSYPLGQLPWKVELTSGSAPELLLNSQIPGAVEKMKSDSVFQGLILPAVLREILTFYLWNDEEREDNEHCEKWMSFASMFAADRPDSADPIELLEWVDEVVREFSENFHFGDLLSEAKQDV